MCHPTSRLLGLLVGLATLPLLATHPQPAPASTSFQGPASPLRLLVATDLHYLAPSLQDGGKAFQDFVASGDGKDLPHLEAIVDAFLAEVRTERPQALILSGDLTLNGEALSHRTLAAKLEGLVDVGIPVFVVPGNHDVDNPWARAFLGDRQTKIPSIPPEDFEAIYRRCGYDRASSRDSASLSYAVSLSPRLVILMLDTNRYELNQVLGGPVTEGSLLPETLGWIKDQAAAAKAQGAEVFAVAHHSLLDHSAVIQAGYTLDNADEVAPLLVTLGVRLVLTGHIHIQDATAKDFPEGRLYDIATGALSVSPNNFGSLLATPQGRLEYHSHRVDVAAWARSHGLKDPYLLDFAAASGAAFRDRASAMLLRGNSPARTLSPKDLAEASRVFGLLNQRYFAGKEALNATDSSLTTGLHLLTGLSGGFTARYVASILADDAVDDNDLVISP